MTIRILALLDDRAGNNAQVLGVAQALGMPFESVTLGYNLWAKLPNTLLGASMRHITASARKRLDDCIHAQGHLVIISAGRRQAPVARWIKKYRPDALLCHLMSPGGNTAAFDLIALPKHDRSTHNSRLATRRIFTLLSPHGLTPDALAAARTKWELKLTHLPHPRIGVLVGGTSKHATFDEKDYQLLARQAAQAAQQSGGSLLITTSRRTDAHGVEAMANAVHNIPHLLYRFGSGDENPYAGILACADALVVTGDSISMASEAAAAGKPLYILSPLKLASKFERFQRALFEAGIARPFALPLDPAWKPAPAPDAAQQVAQAIRGLLPIDDSGSTTNIPLDADAASR